MKIVTLDWFYALAGLVLLLVAVRIARNAAHPTRWTSALFWAILAVVFIGGKALSPLLVGYLVLSLVFLAATGLVKRGDEATTSREERTAEATRLGNRIFWPALLIPAIAVVGSMTLGRIHFGRTTLVDDKQVTLISLGIGVIVAIVTGLRLTGSPVRAPVSEGSRLLQTLGWVLILPQMLAALGAIFARAGVGEVVARLVTGALPTQIPFVAVAAYCVSMAVFTMCMGNAFAAFAVITGGLGLPLIVRAHGGNPAIMAAIGMLSGYCGTLMTPMAANFNLVPALLLELPDKNAVVKVQIPIGLTILALNIALMYFCVGRF